MGEPKQRSVAIDVVRILGVIAVAAGHLWGGVNGDENWVRIATFSWQVPIFFFLTGYLWTRGRPLGGEVKLRATSLLLPYACWTLIFGLPLLAYATWKTGFPGEAVGLTLWGGGLVRGVFAPYWFLPLLFFVAVLLRALERLPRWVSWTAALVGLAASYAFGGELMKLPQDVFFTLPCMLFALVGQEVRRAEPQIRHKGWIALGLLVVAFTLFFTQVIRPLDMKLGDFGTPVASVAASIAICVGLVFAARALLDGRSFAGAKLITELALTSVVVLLTHTFAFFVFSYLRFPQPAVLVLSLVLCWGAALVLHRTPLSVPLVGVPRVSRSTSRQRTEGRSPTRQTRGG